MSESGRHRLIEALEARLEPFAFDMAEKIRAQAEGYVAAMPREHDHDVFVQIRATLAGVRTGRHPSDVDVAIATDVGRRRALAGLPLNGVVDAYHIAHSEMWKELMRMAELDGPEAVNSLARDAALLWAWSHRLASAVADAYSQEAKVLATARASLKRLLFETLTDPTIAVSEGENVLRKFKLDPEARFTVAVFDALSEAEADDLAISISSRRKPVTSCHGGRYSIFLAQGYEGIAFSKALQTLGCTAIGGFGITRTGIVGARMSLKDAKDAQRRSESTGNNVHFSDDWLLSILGSLQDRLEPVFGFATETARSNPGWAETVLAYASSGFSASSAARSLHVHPNSVRYRLERWNEITGWDARELAGLVASVAAIAAAERHRHSER